MSESFKCLFFILTIVSKIFIDRPIFAWVIAIILMVAGTLAIYEGYRQRLLASDLAAKKHNEKRVLSVNLYFMARIAAKLGAAVEARDLVDLADRLHPGKRRVAQQDPVFR